MSAEEEEQIIQEITQFGFEVKKKLGKGAFGVVYLGVKNGESFAIKTIDQQLLQRSEKLTQLFESEKQLMSSIRSKHVIQMYEFYESNRYSYLVMEYCNGGDMMAYMQKKKTISEKEAIGYLIQLLVGFKDLHQNFVIHRDIKLENIMRHYPNGETGDQMEDSKNVVLKLADLGLAKDMKEELLTYTQVGTPVTKAPEIMRQKSYGFEVDMYSLGVVVYQMVYGKFPFMESNERRLLQKIKEQFIDFRSEVKVSDPLKDLIRQMLKYKRKQRIKWTDITDHLALQFDIDLTASRKLEDIQYEEIDLTRTGFQQNNELYEISYYMPQYQFKKKMIKYQESDKSKTFLGYDKEDQSSLLVVQQTTRDYFENGDFEQKSNDLKEIYQILKHINSKYIMQVFQFKLIKEKYYIASDYLMKGNLYDKKLQNKTTNEQEILTILYSVLQGLQMLHENKMMHRNIQLKTIYAGDSQLYTNKILNYRLSNFKYSYLNRNSTKYTINNYKGISHYVAPEILENKVHTYSCDMYSLGIVLYELMYGEVPFKGKNIEELLENIQLGCKQNQKMNESYSQDLIDLVNQMIIPDEKKRINFTDIWSHKVFKSEHFINEKKAIRDIQNFYDDFYGGPSLLNQNINNKVYLEFLEQSLKFSQQPTNFPKPPSLGPISPHVFNYKQNSIIFISQSAVFPIDWISIDTQSKNYFEISNKHKQNINKFQQQKRQSSYEDEEKENQYFAKFVQKMTLLIEQEKKQQNFELCIYYKQVLEEITLKKQKYDELKNNQQQRQIILDELHVNYDKVFKK